VVEEGEGEGREALEEVRGLKAAEGEEGDYPNRPLGEVAAAAAVYQRRRRGAVAAVDSLVLPRVAAAAAAAAAEGG
jgi:hypothetical protein